MCTLPLSDFICYLELLGTRMSPHLEFHGEGVNRALPSCDFSHMMAEPDLRDAF